MSEAEENIFDELSPIEKVAALQQSLSYVSLGLPSLSVEALGDALLSLNDKDFDALVGIAGKIPFDQIAEAGELKKQHIDWQELLEAASDTKLMLDFMPQAAMTDATLKLNSLLPPNIGQFIESVSGAHREHIPGLIDAWRRHVETSSVEEIAKAELQKKLRQSPKAFSDYLQAIAGNLTTEKLAVFADHIKQNLNRGDVEMAATEADLVHSIFNAPKGAAFAATLDFNAIKKFLAVVEEASVRAELLPPVTDLRNALAATDPLDLRTFRTSGPAPN